MSITIDATKMRRLAPLAVGIFGRSVPIPG
jgi:hypothetical protein